MRVRPSAGCSPAVIQPLPQVQNMDLYVDDVAVDGAEDAIRLILELAPDNKR